VRYYDFFGRTNVRHLGQKLKDTRQQQGFKTIVAGAAQLRMSYESLRDYESGRRVPGAVPIAQICRRYKISADWLLGLPQARP
jgi:transcriptional regulator with XRE-family HTH domain